MAHRNVWLPSLDLTILSILTFVREWPKASLSGRLLGLSFYRNSHKGLGMSPSNVSSHATEAPPVSGMGGRYRTLLLCAGTKLVPPCPHVHCWPPACGNTESASEWKTGGKQKWHQLSIWDDLGMVPTWLIGRQWTMLQDATGECHNMTLQHTATICFWTSSSQRISKVSMLPLNRGQLAGHSQRSWIPRLARNQQQWNPIKPICHIPLDLIRSPPRLCSSGARGFKDWGTELPKRTAKRRKAGDLAIVLKQGWKKWRINIIIIIIMSHSLISGWKS